MANSKAGRGKKDPSHMRYMSERHRFRNKMRHVLRYNGAAFAANWEKTYGRTA